DVQSIVSELQGKVNEQLKFPAGYYVTYGGAFENLRAAKQRLMIAVPVSLVLIFLLLYFAFNSIRQGLLIYSAIPLSAIGGILFLALRGMPFSISAGVGFIALFGVAVLNGIVLIAEFNRLRQEGLTDMKRIVIMGTKVRLRPVLMTAFVASLGFLPMALSNGSGAEVQRPLATVVIGGLLIATFLTLFVLPVLYMIFEKGATHKRKNKPPVIAAIFIFIFLGISQFSFSQKSITLDAAIDTALTNNLVLKNETLKTKYRQMLLGTSAIIPQANAFAEAGQINSIYTDTKFGISQTFNFPTVYKRQKELLEEEWKSSLLDVSIKEKHLKKQVTQVFYEMLYTNEKMQLLRYADSLYGAFHKKAVLRLEKGESNILEKASAETLLGQIRIQLDLLKQDSVILQLQFQLLLNSIEWYIPANENDWQANVAAMDTSMLPEHPEIKLIQQQQQVAQAGLQLAKSKLSPDLSFGYNNTSIRGTGADDKYYSTSKRFSAVQVGIGIPIFSRAQKARISSEKINVMLAERNYDVGLQNIRSHYNVAFFQYKKYQQAVQYFQKNILRNSDLVNLTANKQLAAGNINYLDWVQLINQSITAKSDYIDAIKNLNQSIIDLNYFTNK
ncbi:MAG: efflux RND transporter permease subunit, partial [Ginsengibacter sp.]